MRKAVFYGRGEIEFRLPSKPEAITLKKGQGVEIEDERDVKVVKALVSLGMKLEGKPDKVKKTTEVVEETTKGDMEVIIPEVETVQVEASEVTEKYTLESLMKFNSSKIREIATSLGIEVPEGASKKEMSTMILEKLGE